MKTKTGKKKEEYKSTVQNLQKKIRETGAHLKTDLARDVSGNK